MSGAARKVAVFAFKGEPMCFAHALLNVMDMRGRGMEAVLVLEGTATKTADEMSDRSKPFADLYWRVKDAGFIDSACNACSMKTGAFEGLKAQGLRFRDEMSGHPSTAAFIEEGYEILIF